MTDPHSVDATPTGFADLPLQPTGSGVADLEIAFEQMRLSEADAAPEPTRPTGDPAAESEAHPS